MHSHALKMRKARLAVRDPGGCSWMWPVTSRSKPRERKSEYHGDLWPQGKCVTATCQSALEALSFSSIQTACLAQKATF